VLADRAGDGGRGRTAGEDAGHVHGVHPGAGVGAQRVDVAHVHHVAALDREVEQDGGQREQDQAGRLGRREQQRGHAQGNGRPAYGHPEAAVAQPPGHRRGDGAAGAD
jgi:hypothetical protein